MECKKCRHFYRKMTNSIGYNPVPFCHLRDDTGRQPDALGRSCFEPCETTEQFQKRVFGKLVLRYDETFRYQLLDRLMMVWRSFPVDKQPEWLTWEQICEYKTLMEGDTE